MPVLSAEERSEITAIAGRYGVGTDAALAVLDALVRSGGTMAQFNHPELGGSGQWMPNGMIMIGDMFNQSLKAAVDGLCRDLLGWLDRHPVVRSGAHSDFPFQQSQAQGQSQALGQFQQGQFQGPGGSVSLGSVSIGGGWWPAELGVPSVSASQNDIRVVWFAASGRLAVEQRGRVTIYDTGDHVISSVSQQQQNGVSSVTLISQYGVVPVASLPVVTSADAGFAAGVTPSAPAAAPAAPVTPPPAEAASVPVAVGTAPQPVPTAPAPAVAPPAPAAPSAAGPMAPQDRLENTDWCLRSAAPGAPPIGTPHLAPDGQVTGDGPDTMRYWGVEAGALWFYDADGRPTARFGLPAPGSEAVVLTGADPAVPDTAYLLEPARPAAEPARGVGIDLRIDLTGCPWRLVTAEDTLQATLRLQADGGIAGGGPNEARWRLDGPALLLLHGSGRPTARFDVFEFRDGAWTLSGHALADPGRIYRLWAESAR